MKSAGKARSNGLYRHIRTSKEIIRNLLNDYIKRFKIKDFLNSLHHYTPPSSDVYSTFSLAHSQNAFISIGKYSR